MSSYRKFTLAISSADEFLVDLSEAISRKRCKIGGKLLLITNRKSYQKSVTLNDLERRNGRYIALFR